MTALRDIGRIRIIAVLYAEPGLVWTIAKFISIDIC